MSLKKGKSTFNTTCAEGRILGTSSLGKRNSTLNSTFPEKKLLGTPQRKHATAVRTLRNGRK
jgi:hypothetical protein